MKNERVWIGGLAILLFVILGFFIPTGTAEQRDWEQARVGSGSKISVPNIERQAFAKLEPFQKEEMRLLYGQIEEDSINVALYKQIAGKWFTFASPEMSGVFAEKIATKVDTDTAWSIAGSTFYIAQGKMDEGDLKQFCLTRATQSFENAVSLNPSSLEHKMNRAQIDVDNPPKDNPMKGVLMLINLSKANPNHVGLNIKLAELGMKTGQWEKAKSRLQKVLQQDENNARAHCLLSEVFGSLGKTEEQELHRKLCTQSI